MVIFEEVTQAAGISNLRAGESSFWRDFNGDGWSDLLIGWHSSTTILYQNNGDGTFTDVTSAVFSPPQRSSDNHGAAWVDFDNDGDQDLVQLVGAVLGTGNGGNNLYVNTEGILSDQASELGIDYPLGRGRTPSWLDFDQDGLLDLVTSVTLRSDGEAPPTIFRQTNSGFEDVGSTIGFEPGKSVSFAILSDLSGDKNLDLIVKSEGSRPVVYDISSLPFQDITSVILPNSSSSQDIAIADFNNDLRPDLYSTLTWDTSDLSQTGSNNAVAWLGVNQGTNRIQFDTEGEVTFSLYIPNHVPPIPGLLSQGEVYIGAEGFNPMDEDPTTRHSLEFTLSLSDPRILGIPSYQSGIDRGVYIGYNPTIDKWQVTFLSPERNTLPLSIQSSEPLSDLTTSGFSLGQTPAEERLFLNSDFGLVDYSQESGINQIQAPGVSVVSGDFNNDMYLDLYVVATDTVSNRPNILYENQGDGTFIIVPNAAGAAGTSLGIGSKVTTVDYDRDGFLDLFVTNKSQLADNPPFELFRNLGNDNHWLEIDLEGVESNRDGIGAQVLVKAGGITQLREQTGGIHNGAQNDQRIHFGLANNNVVDELIIKWPSGIEQTLTDIPADQIIQIVEPENNLAEDLLVNDTDTESEALNITESEDTVNDPFLLDDLASNNDTDVKVEAPNLTELDDLVNNALLLVDDLASDSEDNSLNPDEPNNTLELFRFRNSSFDFGAYIFVGANERDEIQNSNELSNIFFLEGEQTDGTINPAFKASLEPGDDLIPFYRLASLVVPGTFLYVSTEEYDAIFAEDSNQQDQWEKQGLDQDSVDIPEFYLLSGSADRGIEFHRFQNTQNGTFFYAGPGERELIASDPNLSNIFLNQGVAFKALP